MKYENEKEDKTHTVGSCLNAAMHSCGLIVYYRLFIQKKLHSLMVFAVWSETTCLRPYWDGF